MKNNPLPNDFIVWLKENKSITFECTQQACLPSGRAAQR
jgi:hypothetical protein